jgi:hypothetical protein
MQAMAQPFAMSMALVMCVNVAVAVAAQDVSQPRQNTDSPATQPHANVDQRTLALADAPAAERQTIERLLASTSWPKRAFAALRLERYGCDESRDVLTNLLKDKAWQARAFAVRALARRRIKPPETNDWFASESEPRVLRTALRHRYVIDPARIERGVRILARSNDLEDKMLAVELGVFSANADMLKLVTATAKQIILKMNRGEAGVLSSRLAIVTGARGLRRAQQWQSWLMKTGRQFQVRATHDVDEGVLPAPLSSIAQLESESFCNMEDYIAKLGEKEVDLAIALDCTASMSGEIAAAQAGIDEMMLFVGDMVSSLRVGVVAYRDRRDEFETKLFEFTDDIAAARQQIWTLVADGGGDSPEAVFPAIKAALSQLSWRPGRPGGVSSKVLVIVGDAPPHVGFGHQCVTAVESARAQFQLTTHAIQAEGKEVKFFPEIAKAGGGLCVSLDDDDTLMAEITGLALGDRFQNEFREFFRIYLDLCR